MTVEIREYLDRSGRSSFADWFDRLNEEAGAKITTALVRIQQGNFSNAKGIGAGVYEYRILALVTGFISGRTANNW